MVFGRKKESIEERKQAALKALAELEAEEAKKAEEAAKEPVSSVLEVPSAPKRAAVQEPPPLPKLAPSELEAALKDLGENYASAFHPPLSPNDRQAVTQGLLLAIWMELRKK
jgi:hypothetical protein